MTENFCHSPEVAPRTGRVTSILIPGGTDIRIPRRCVVCDSENVVLSQQTQDGTPVITPFGALLPSTDATLPYCETHARRARRRARVFGLVQLAIASGLPLALVGHETAMIGRATTFSLFVAAILAFCVTWAVKPHYLYDVRIKHVAGGTQFTSRYATFLRRVQAENARPPQNPFDTEARPG